VRTIRAYVVTGPNVIVYGDTYQVRNRLKELGARFLPQTKAWQMPHSPTVVEGLLAMGFVPESPSHSATYSAAGSAQVRERLDSSSTAPLAAASLAGAPLTSIKEFSVAELCLRVGNAIQTQLPSQFWIVGELIHVQNSRGHVWLEIADHEQPESIENRKRASISGVIWNGVLSRLKCSQTSEKPVSQSRELPLQVGLKVRLFGHIDFRAEGSRVSIIVDDIDAEFTQGQLALTRERILADLRKRGLLDLNRRLPFSAFPLKIALITANDSRARNDFLHELGRSGLAFQVSLFDCRMQGEGTAADVTMALSVIRTRSEGRAGLSPMMITSGRSIPAAAFDVVVITRGGGSRMDLRWFDDLEICKAIATCPLPVVTAIGHFEDSSISDAVAAIAEKTPTAAAQVLVSRCAQSMAVVEETLTRLSSRAMLIMQNERSRLTSILERAGRSALQRLARERQRVDAIVRLLELAQRQVGRSLERGFALIWDNSRQHSLGAEELLAAKPQSVWIELRLPPSAHSAESATDKELPKRLFLPARIDYSAGLIEAQWDGSSGDKAGIENG
jgi:exodeoxyribonuclease VII large subunit